MKVIGLLMLLAVTLTTSSPVWGSDAPSGTTNTGADRSANEVPPRSTPGGDQRTYGITSFVAHTIGAYAFDPFTSAQTYAGMVGTGDRYLTTSGTMLAPLNLPAGAVVTAVEIQGCDTSAAGEVRARFFSNTTVSGVQSEINHGVVSTGVAATPGCDFFFALLGTPVVIDNFNRTYYLEETNGTFDSTTRFSAVRLYYNLQVSAAPATATFVDVPTTHGFFQFIEALAAAGITGGCNVLPPRYCPDDPVTRGQMAVFISRALGLHFVP